MTNSDDAVTVDSQGNISSKSDDNLSYVEDFLSSAEFESIIGALEGSISERAAQIMQLMDTTGESNGLAPFQYADRLYGDIGREIWHTPVADAYVKLARQMDIPGFVSFNPKTASAADVGYLKSVVDERLAQELANAKTPDEAWKLAPKIQELGNFDEVTSSAKEMAEDTANGNTDNKIHLQPYNDEIRSILEEAGLDQSKIDEIVNTPKGQKPDPSSYLSQAYIDNHLSEFESSGVYKILATPPSGTIGKSDGTFVMSGNQLASILSKADGDIHVIEDMLGLPYGALGNNPYVVQINNYTGLRMPTGNEASAFIDYWMPGGYTSGGIKEAVINAAPEGTYTYFNLF